MNIMTILLMYLTLQALVFEQLDVIPGQFLWFPIIYNVSVVCACFLCIWVDQMDRLQLKSCIYTHIIHIPGQQNTNENTAKRGCSITRKCDCCVAFKAAEHTTRALRALQLLRHQGPSRHNLKFGAVQMTHGVIQEEPLLLKDNLPVSRDKKTNL